jgi:hypothetical protein
MSSQQNHLGDPDIAEANRPGVIVKTLTVAFAGSLWLSALQAATVPVPNASFESPATSSVDTRIDSWEKTPKPLWWDEAQYGPWDQLIGAFANPPSGDASHIDNCEGNQAIWVFANPEVGLFQDYTSTDWSNSTPTHAFDARFEPGKSYRLTVGVLVGTAIPMAEGATLELSLYYRDAASNRFAVATTTITNSPSVFSNGTHFLDFQVNVPPVKSGDAWAGQRLGIAMMSLVGSAQPGGYWDIDHIRLTANRAPVLSGATAADGSFGFHVEGEPGQKIELLASTDLGLSVPNWTSLGTWTNTTGSLRFTEPVTGQGQRFYRAREAP